MGSNEVIIDGVNVAECEYTNGLYNGVYGCINLSLNPACCKNPDCYFKQLQRAKAENEKLKKELEWQKVANRKVLLDKDFLTSELRDLRIEYAKLYQLNEKLKKALEEVEKYCNECNLKADYTACEVLKIINEVLENE